MKMIHDIFKVPLMFLIICNCIILSTYSVKAEIDLVPELKENAEQRCKALLYPWLIERSSLEQPLMQNKLVSCYVGNVRLSVLDSDNSHELLPEIDISELPSKLLKNETGIDLDFYNVLVGKDILTLSVNKEK